MSFRKGSRRKSRVWKNLVRKHKNSGMTKKELEELYKKEDEKLLRRLGLMPRKLSRKKSNKRIKALKKQGYQIKEIILPNGDVLVLKRYVSR